MSQSTSQVTRHLEAALEESDPEEMRFHVRQAMQYVQGLDAEKQESVGL